MPQHAQLEECGRQYRAMCMQYHIVYHLHPYIPLVRTPAAYREIRPKVEACGCDLDEN